MLSELLGHTGDAGDAQAQRQCGVTQLGMVAAQGSTQTQPMVPVLEPASPTHMAGPPWLALDTAADEHALRAVRVGELATGARGWYLTARIIELDSNAFYNRVVKVVDPSSGSKTCCVVFTGSWQSMGRSLAVGDLITVSGGLVGTPTSNLIVITLGDHTVNARCTRSAAGDV